MRSKRLSRRICSSLALLACLQSGCAALSTVPTVPGAAPAGAAAAPTPVAPPPTTAQAGSTTVVAVAPPAQPCCKQTLPEWLGLTNCCAKITRILAAIPGLVGIFSPGMGNTLADAASQPPLLPINSPQNLQSSNPAVQTAAQVKNDENQAKQKIAAIQYLATIGCAGCYPGVEEALLASLDDCTESVRFAAAKALHDTSGRPCRNCNTKACCSTRVRERLMQVAYDMKDNACYQESSPRVRRMARLALVNCGNCLDAPTELPLEGPAQDPKPTPKVPAVPAPAATASVSVPQAQPDVKQWAARTRHSPATRASIDPIAPLKEVPNQANVWLEIVPAGNEVEARESVPETSPINAETNKEQGRAAALVEPAAAGREPDKDQPER